MLKLPGREEDRSLVMVVDAPYVHLKVWPLVMRDGNAATMDVSSWMMEDFGYDKCSLCCIRGGG